MKCSKSYCNRAADPDDKDGYCPKCRTWANKCPRVIGAETDRQKFERNIPAHIAKKFYKAGD